MYNYRINNNFKGNKDEKTPFAITNRTRYGNREAACGRCT